GDLHAFLKKKGALKTAMAVRFALDISRHVVVDRNDFRARHVRILKVRGSSALFVELRVIRAGND
ncbi:hypothetical protein U1Q18_010449, partial [Sarracenia purpurea var. burkii]